MDATDSPGFDADAAAHPDAGIFGLDHNQDKAALVLVPVPFDATVSYGAGTAAGPQAILQASHQVDLYDLQTGRPYQQGICMLPADSEIAQASKTLRQLAAPLIAKGGGDAGDAGDAKVLAQINEGCLAVHAKVRASVQAILAQGKLPGVVGGDHSVAFGAIQAVAAAHPGMGILQVDAHADLRSSFEGFRWSHASIMANVLDEVADVSRLVQVGIRDLGEGELKRASHDNRVFLHQDLQWRQSMARGETYQSLCDQLVQALPAEVYVSFDIDGLDPSLCPNTGTPVPGGLSFAEACILLQTVVDSGRRIVGFDLCEVAPAADGGEWDANVGARILYKLCGFALL